MALNKKEGAQIKSLMREERWEAVIKFVAMKLEQWRKEKITGGTEFEALRALHTRDGKVEGVEEIFDQMERAAFED